MSNAYKKDLAGLQDLFFDTNGTNESFSRETSTGLSQNIKGLNASDLPLLLATRSLELYDQVQMSADEVDSAITQICASLASIHKFQNQDVLDDIDSAGSGAIITTQERDKLNSITDTGSGEIITDAERSKLTEIVGLTQAQIDAITSITNILPIGTVIGFPTNSPPTGFLECNGNAVSRVTYSDLFGLIGTTYGNGNGTTTFNLPDYRGQLLRGWDHGRGADPDAASRTDRGDGTTGDNVGTNQLDELKSHNHLSGTSVKGDFQIFTSTESISGTSGAERSTVNQTLRAYTADTGGNETRPRNTSIMFCIRWSI